MKKRILLISTIIILSIFSLLKIASITAATEDGTYISRFYHEVEGGEKKYYVSVVLPSNNEIDKNNNKLTQGKIKSLIETKYSQKNIVKNIYKEDGTTLLNRGDYVGTGYVIELTTGRKVTVILYGDVTKDGIVDTDDTVAIAKHNVSTVTLDSYQEKAARLTVKNEQNSEVSTDNIDTNDTVRVAYYNVNSIGTEKTGYMIIDEELLPEDEEEVIDINEFIDEVNSEEDKFQLELVDNTIHFNINKEKQDSVIDLENEKLVTAIENALHNGKIKNIELTFDGSTMWLNKEDDKETIVNKLCELLKYNLSINVTANYTDADYYEKIKEELAKKTLDDLLTMQLNIKVNKEETAKFAENQGENYSVVFSGTLFLDKIVEENQSVLDDLITLSYDKENDIITTINAKVNDRSKKMSSVCSAEGAKVFEKINELLHNGRVSTITLDYVNKAEETDVVALELTENDNKEQITSKITDWLKNNTQTIFGKDKFDDAIVGNLENKELKVIIKTKDNIKLEDEKTEREYSVKFNAVPITVTFEWKYKEDGKDEDRVDTVTLVNAGKIEEKDRPKYMVTEDGGTEKETDIREEKNNEKYKLMGWKKDLNSNEKFDFNTEVIEVNTTLKADWKKIDDIDAKIIDIINKYNNGNAEAKNIFHLDYDLGNEDAEKIRIDILNKDKKLSEIEKTGLMLSLQDFLKTQNLAKVKVSANSKDLYSSEGKDFSSVTTEEIKSKIIEILGQLISGDTAGESTKTSDEIKLESLIGKSVTITLNQSNQDSEFAKVYILTFEEVLKKDNILSEAINGLDNENVYKYTYENSHDKTNGKLNIEVMTSATNLDTLEGTNSIAILNKLLKDGKVKDVSLIYGEDKEKSLGELAKGASNTSEIKEAIKTFLKENWKEICSCTTECCADGNCSWEKATNNCLIEGEKDLQLKVTLSDSYEFDVNDTKTAIYDIDFVRTKIKVTIHKNNPNDETSIQADEGKPLMANAIEDPTYDYKHYFKNWCKDVNLKQPFAFEEEKVTAGLELYANYYNVVDTKQDLKNKITEMASTPNVSETIADKIREKIEENNNVTIQLENGNETKDINYEKDSILYQTALAKVLDAELEVPGVQKMSVTVEGNESIDFAGGSTDNTEAKNKLKENLGGSILNDILGKKLTVEIYLDGDNAISETEKEQLETQSMQLYGVAEASPDIKFDINFEGIVTKKNLSDFGKKIVTSYVNGNNMVKVTFKDNGDIDATVQGKQKKVDTSKLFSFPWLLSLQGVEFVEGKDLYDSMAGAVANGCGGKTALKQFFEQEKYMNKLEFITDEEIGQSGKKTELTRADSGSDADIGSALVDLPGKILPDGGIKTEMNKFNGKHLNIIMHLEKNWKFENESMSMFKMNVIVKKVDDP